MRSKRGKVWTYKHTCIQCGRCCRNIVCDLGVILLATTRIPCPALKFDGKRYWCGLLTDTSEYVFPLLGLTKGQYDIVKAHILSVNNLWEGCDLERWTIAKRDDMPLISKGSARKAVPSTDCSGREYSKSEREDLARYILLGAEMQRDAII